MRRVRLCSVVASLSPLRLCALAIVSGCVALGGLVLLEAPASRVGIVVAALAALIGLHAGTVLQGVRRSGVAWWPVAGQLAVTAAAIVLLGGAWISVVSLMAVSLLLLAESRRSGPLWVAAVAAGPAMVALTPWSEGDRVAVWAVCVPALVVAEYVVVCLAARAHFLALVRADEVGRAVEDERRRLNRDLHDLVGHRLAVLVLKIDLVQRLVETGDPKAQLELDEALDLVRGVTAEVRSVAHGRTRVRLEAELSSARSILEASGARCVVEAAACDAVPEEISWVLADVLREGVTNILRHASARACEIRVAECDDVIRLTLVNDRLRASGDGTGQGLRNLRERMAEIGGSLEAYRTAEGLFLLRATVDTKARPNAFGWMHETP
ncbi:sensor histidine kinase [Nonomuraea sp. NPDC050663]|uniref:sensor histidine kinase n=1 Tax=Nonomuraea sp. NPDC050663 TaxID=3364370 RepID=UPI0037BADE8E